MFILLTATPGEYYQWFLQWYGDIIHVYEYELLMDLNGWLA